MKKMRKFHRPCSGSTAAVARWYWNGDVPCSQPLMRFRLLGIQVTKTLTAKSSEVRRYARLMGSSTTNLLARREPATRMRAYSEGEGRRSGAAAVTVE